MTAPPIPMLYADGVFTPLPRFHNLAAASYGEGEVVDLVAVEQHSAKSRAHEFAWLREAWLNLPEAIADQFPSTEHLRKRALILGGFYDETILDAGSNAAALRAASFIRAREEFTHIVVRGPLVVTRTAKSQSSRAMDKVEFQASKTAVLNIVADLIGVPAETLTREADKAA